MIEQSIEFTREFAQLVWLLVHRPALIEEQKSSLRRTLSESARGRRIIALTELNHSLVDAVRLVPPPPELPWLSLLAARMAEHSAGMLDFSEKARPADVLGLARALASPPKTGDDGVHFDAMVVAVNPSTVAARIGRAGFTRRSTPLGSPKSMRTPPLGAGALGGNNAGVMDVSDGERFRRVPVGRIAETPAPMLIIPEPTPLQPSDLPSVKNNNDPAKTLLEATFTRGHGELSVDVLFQRLAEATTPADTSRAADDLVRTAEQLARDEDWSEVTKIFARLLSHEERLTDPEQRRAWLIHVRRLCTPGTLRSIAQLLTRKREMRDAGQRILSWSGEVGADVLLDLLISSDQSSDRRAYRTAILACPSAATPLMHMLDDDRWFVVRNAVELLGDLNATVSDAKVAATLKHSDARVRRSATTALAKLATARALPTILPMLHDTSASVRLAAVHGLSQLRSPRAVSSLLSALDRETDVEVQHAIYGALANHPTDAAVERLAQAAQPGSLLNRRSAAVRLPAVHALAEAGTASAYAALRVLASDRDREVRSAAERLLGARGAQQSSR